MPRRFERMDAEEIDGPYEERSSAPPLAHAASSRHDWSAPQLVREKRGVTASMDVGRGRFPFALVWTPIPFISWLLPFVGHLGICDSRGVAYDFAGPYSIGVDDLSFGAATRYLVMDPGLVPRPPGLSAAEAWDAGIDAGNDVYCRRMHNLIWCVAIRCHLGAVSRRRHIQSCRRHTSLEVRCAIYPCLVAVARLCSDNCHSHVARCLNSMAYGGSRDYNMIVLAGWMFFAGECPRVTLAPARPSCPFRGHLLAPTLYHTPHADRARRSLRLLLARALHVGSLPGDRDGSGATGRPDEAIGRSPLSLLRRSYL
jgi:hypothetical protein